MILISFSIALIAIIFGVKLLAQSQKDNLGNLYKYVSWFVIVMGFLVLMCDGARSVLRCCHMRRNAMMMSECRMMDGNCGPGMMRRGMGNCNRMMGCGRNNCWDGMMNCPDGGKSSSCNEGAMNSGACPMMGKMKCNSDSGKPGK